jgi:uncharacterized protein (TIGR02996 family)
MSTEAGLLEAITVNRTDDTARLVYADWLDENGEPDRAEHLRLQVQLVREWWYDKPCVELYACIAELAGRIDPTWLAMVRRSTTPAPPVNVEELFPELRGKGKMTVRLHPRPGEAPVDASKIGGMFLWPKRERWPVCPDHDIPYVTALQLRKEDVPELDFPPDADLFQLLWCPKEHEDRSGVRPMIFWRRRSDVTEPRKWPSQWRQRRELYDESADTILKPCRVHPERVTEYAGYRLISNSLLSPALLDITEMVRGFRLSEDLGPPDNAERLAYSWLCEAPGTKVGGYTHWNQHGDNPLCDCGSQVEHLLSFASREFDAYSWGRWVPIEDRPAAADNDSCGWLAVGEPLCRMFGRCSTMYVFVCRNHEERPVWTAIF